MAENTYTVTYDSASGQWEMNVVGAPRSDFYQTKKRAVETATYRARDKFSGSGEVKIYGRDGKLQDVRTYSERNNISKKSSGGGIFDSFL